MSASFLFSIVSGLLVVGWVCGALLRAPGARCRKCIVGFGVVWLAAPSAIAASGALADFAATPPRMLLVLPAVLTASSVFAFSPRGRALLDHVSTASLIGFQAFRFLPETLLGLAYAEGLAPVQMTAAGRNWDALTAVLAAAVWLAWRREGDVPRWAAVGWSLIGLGLLANILVIAVLSMPTPFRVFMNEPANRFVATFPYILLPAVHVAAAIGGHLLVLRKISRR